MTQRNRIIRLAVPADAEAVAELERECFSSPWSEREILSTMSQDNAVFIVCTDRNSVCGYLGAYFAADEGYITNIAVTEDFRRCGIASALIERLKDEGKKLGLDFWTLEVRKSNLGARALYENVGFETVGIRPRFYSKPTEDAVLMTYSYRKERKN